MLLLLMHVSFFRTSIRLSNFQFCVTVCVCVMCVCFIYTVVNECELDLHNCSDLAMCSDLPVGFVCTCVLGFTGNGIVCEGGPHALT